MCTTNVYKRYCSYWRKLPLSLLCISLHNVFVTINTWCQRKILTNWENAAVYVESPKTNSRVYWSRVLESSKSYERKTFHGENIWYTYVLIARNLHRAGELFAGMILLVVRNNHQLRQRNFNQLHSSRPDIHGQRYPPADAIVAIRKAAMKWIGIMSWREAAAAFKKKFNPHWSPQAGRKYNVLDCLPQSKQHPVTMWLLHGRRCCRHCCCLLAVIVHGLQLLGCSGTLRV